MKRIPLAIGIASLAAVLSTAAPGEVIVTVENVSAGSSLPTPLAPGVWAVVAPGTPNPLFVAGEPDAGLGLEALAEDGNPGPLAAALAGNADVTASGVFNVPDGTDGPGPLLPGATYSFTVDVTMGMRLYFATMFVQSNDLFYAPGDGLELMGKDGMPMTGDMTPMVQLWDAGTEQNEQPGTGPNQAPRQSGANTGPAENGTVQEVETGDEYPETAAVIKVSITEATN